MTLSHSNNSSLSKSHSLKCTCEKNIPTPTLCIYCQKYQCMLQKSSSWVPCYTSNPRWNTSTSCISPQMMLPVIALPAKHSLTCRQTTFVSNFNAMVYYWNTGNPCQNGFKWVPTVCKTQIISTLDFLQQSWSTAGKAQRLKWSKSKWSQKVAWIHLTLGRKAFYLGWFVKTCSLLIKGQVPI